MLRIYYSKIKGDPPWAVFDDVTNRIHKAMHVKAMIPGETEKFSSSKIPAYVAFVMKYDGVIVDAGCGMLVITKPMKIPVANP